jgi:hypothetical protein
MAMNNSTRRVAFTFAVVCGCLLTLVAAAVAADPEWPPQVVLAGFDAYNVEGAEAAVKAWLKDGPHEGSKEAMGQANIFRQIESLYGKYKGHETLHTKNIGSSTKVVYEAINFERGAAFARFLLYKVPDKGWATSNMIFNTAPQAVLPKSQIE